MATQCGQNEGVAPQACRGIDDVLVLFGIDGFGNQFAAAFLSAVIQATRHKIHIHSAFAVCLVQAESLCFIKLQIQAVFWAGIDNGQLKLLLIRV